MGRRPLQPGCKHYPPLLRAIAWVLQNARALCPCGLAQTPLCGAAQGRVGGGRGPFAGF